MACVALQLFRVSSMALLSGSGKTTKPGRIRALLALKPVKLNTGVRDDVVRVVLFLHDALLQLRLYAYAQQ